MAEEVVSVALGTLRDLLLEEGRFLVRVGGEVKALEKQLKEINCLLRDADAKQHESETVRNWITEIRDLAYRAEDVVAEYSVRMSSSSSSSSDGWGRRLVRRFSGVLRCCSLHRLGSEMLDIKLDLERITKLMEAYGIRNIITDSGDNRNPARKTFPSSEIGDCFVGKEEELKGLASLLADDKQHRVISVWGMGGIGKTTIAKKVYNQMKEVRSSSFDSFAWVCISQQCQTRSVWEDVLKQLDPAERGESVSSLSDTGLIEKLCEVQRAKRCLIVVDDLWQTSHWDGLKPAFLVQNVESKILVTTRKRKVADIGFPIQLGLLSVDDAWELLKKKAFPHRHIPEFAFEEKLLLEKVGKEMVEKCGRLPLAISLLGGVLSKKKSMDEWESVKENLSAYLHSGDGIIEEENEMLAVLNLSYEDLPYYLKPCFLYLGVFKEDETICPDNLYKRWIAQGMISDEMIGGERKTLTHVAEFCLSELVSRCMIQVEVDDALPSLKYTTCKLHDAMRELCLSMGKRQEFGVEVLEYRYGKFESSLHEASSSSNVTIKARHLAIHFPGEFQLEGGGGDLTITNCERLRSLELLNVDLIILDNIQLPPKSVIDFEKFKMLRELLIKNFSFKGRKLPRGITKLVHLRYLGIQSSDLDELPSSISNLAYLDTLDLSGSLNLRVPNHAFKKMLRFKHLILPYCFNIGHHRLRLDEGLDELETLEGFDSRVHELKSTVTMANLRRFIGDIHDNESLLAILNAITRNWNKLEFCLVSIKHGCELGLLSTSEGVLMKLKEAFTCPNLHGMGIHVWVGSIGKILDECILSSKLESLILQDCRIEDDPMGVLGNLPCLTQLCFYEDSYVGEEMMCPASSFSCLKKLDFEDLPNLREWRVEQGSMPLLSRLKIGRCRSFEEWRVERGAMPLLSELKIFACPALKKVPDRVSKHVSS